MKLYAGLDLHSDNTYVGISDEEDDRRFKGKVSNDLPTILKVLQPFKENIAGVVVESTYNWYWLVDGLSEHGYTVHLANPCAIKPYKGLKHTDDKHDAFFLAQLLRLGILPEGYIFPKEERHLRDLLRKRLKLVNERAMHIIGFKSIVNRNTGGSIKTNDVRSLKPDGIEGFFENEHLQRSAEANIAIINFLNEEIRDVEKMVMKAVQSRPAFEKLMTVPGIGKSLALTILLETGDIGRFPSVGDYASYCRCVGSSRLSNEKVKGGNNRKNGNKYLSWAYVEAAVYCRRFCSQADVFYRRKLLKRNKVVAVKALAHKIARACYYIMRDDVPFDQNRMFGTPTKTDKGCGSEPARGLNQSHSLIGPSAAAT